MPAHRNTSHVAIVGAGLSGLATAVALTDQGLSVSVFEAREDVGGRIRSVIDPHTGDYLADLGPTWVWPAYQPTLRRWIDALGLPTFDQFITGKSVLDYGPGTLPELLTLPSQLGNVRLVGGPRALIRALLARLPPETVRTGCTVESISVGQTSVSLRLAEEPQQDIRCDQLVVAVPPRIGLNTIAWDPALPAGLAASLDSVPTWMAPQAKVVALYQSPFWRDRGLSGRILSHSGPLAEVHDHSGPDGDPAALFGFVGWSAQTRATSEPDLESHVRSQLTRCFGEGSPEPLAVHAEDWAIDPLVSSPRDLSEPAHHQAVGPEELRRPHANGRLWFAGAETAQQSPGLIEGAIEAAERVAAGIAGAK